MPCVRQPACLPYRSQEEMPLELVLVGLPELKLFVKYFFFCLHALTIGKKDELPVAKERGGGC